MGRKQPGAVQKHSRDGAGALARQVDDKQGYRAWLKALKPLEPLTLWADFVVKNKLPPLTFSFEAAAVYSSNSEGNSMDLRAFLESKAGRTSRHFKAKERKEIEALIEACRFARTHALSDKNLLQAHALLSRPLLPKAKQGRYRDQLMFVNTNGCAGCCAI